MHFNSILPDTFPIVTEIPSTVENQTNQGMSQTIDWTLVDFLFIIMLAEKVKCTD